MGYFVFRISEKKGKREKGKVQTNHYIGHQYHVICLNGFLYCHRSINFFLEKINK